MRRPIQAACLTALFLLSSVSGNRLQAATYDLDVSHTSIIFGISHMGLSYTYGRFNEAKGRFNWDASNPAACQFQIAINASSIDSNDARRDGHLKGADFFNVGQFPQITFVSTGVTPAPANNPAGTTHNVTGNLTMHGVTKEITLPMKYLGDGQGPDGSQRCGFFCQTTLKRSDFGMTGMIPNIGDEVAVTVSFEGVMVAGASPVGTSAAGSGSATSGSGSASR